VSDTNLLWAKEYGLTISVRFISPSGSSSVSETGSGSMLESSRLL